MIEVNAVKGSANSVGQVLFGKGSIGLDDPAFTMGPLGFNRVEPGTFDRQEANQDANAFSGPFDRSIMFSNPSPHSFAGVPAGIIPNHCQNRFAQFLDFLAGPLQELDRNATHRPTINEAQEHFLKPQIICCHPAQQHAITSQGFGIRVIFLFGLFHQSHRLFFFTPTRQVGLGKAAPPSFVLKAPHPAILLCQRNYPVSGLFFRSYAGSGLVIQCLARFQETFNLFKACRTQSPLIKRGVIPSPKLISAANSSVQTLVSLPKSRGLRCNKAFNCSNPSSLKTDCALFGRREPISSAATPRSLNATMALRTVWSSQPRNSAIRGALSPRALDKMIWLRLTVNGLEERTPAFSLSRSPSIKSHTNTGLLMPTTIPSSRISLSGLH